MIKGKLLKWLCCGSFLIPCIFIILIFTPAVNYFYQLLEVNENLKKCDAIILLSGGQYTETLLDKNTYHRLFYAVDLYQNGFVENIIICGGFVGCCPGRPVTISESIKEVLVKLGVPENNIFLEKKSQNTYESLRNINKMKDAWGKTFLIVTSSYHMYRSMAIARKLGLNAYAAPVECYEKNIDHLGLRTRGVFDIIREYGAICYFWLKGWI